MNQHGRGDGQAPKGSGTATAHGQAARQGTAATHAGRKPGEGIQPFIVPHQPSEETPALAGTLPSGSGGPEMEDPGQGTPERLPRDAVPLQYSFLESPTGSGAWWAAVHKAAKSQTRLKQLAHARTRPTGKYASQLTPTFLW